MSAAAPRRVLGIDPGTRVTGWGVVETTGNRMRLVACGALRLDDEEIAARLLAIREGLRGVVAEHAPSAVALERPFLGKNPHSALTVGMARGVAMLAAADAGLEVREYSPAVVKKAVVGNGNASKHQVAQMVRVILGLPSAPEPADATDALAVALAEAHRAGLRGPLARLGAVESGT